MSADTPSRVSPSAARMDKSGNEDLRCNFCHRGKDATTMFISGGDGYICRECVGLCNDIFAEYDADSRSPASEPVQAEAEYRRELLDDAHQSWAEEAKWRERLAEAIARVLKLQPQFHSTISTARNDGRIDEEAMTKMQAAIGRLSRILGASDRADKESLGESCFCHLPKCKWHSNQRRLSDDQARAIILYYDCGYTGDRPLLESAIERLRSTVREGPWLGATMPESASVVLAVDPSVALPKNPTGTNPHV